MRLHWSLILHISTWLPMSIKLGPMSSSCPVPLCSLHNLQLPDNDCTVIAHLFLLWERVISWFHVSMKTETIKDGPKTECTPGLSYTNTVFSFIFLHGSLKHLNLRSIDLCIYSCAYITFLKLPCCQRIFPMLWNN